jgi:hypothetical protein
MTKDTDRLLYSYDDAMHKLGDLGRTKFYELVDEGQLTRVKIGRRGFVTAESLGALVDRLSEAATA